MEQMNCASREHEMAPGWPRSQSLRLSGLIGRIATIFAVNADAVSKYRRGSPSVVRVRQIVMYLAHVALGLSPAQIALVLDRDRSSVKLALRVIEDGRDDPAFDQFLARLEESLKCERGGI